MRQSWTDERLDDFRERVDERFDAVDRRFDGIDRRLDRLDERLATELPRLHDRIDSVQRTMVQACIAFLGIQMTGFIGLAGLILAQG